MKLKYLAIVFAALFLILGAVSADDVLLEEFDNESSALMNDVDYFDGPTVCTLGELDFTIPAGYGPVDKGSIHHVENGVRKDGEFFVNEKEKIIAICVFSGNPDNDLSHYGPQGCQKEKETINGHDGLLCTEDFYKFFAYKDKNSVVLIQAPSVADIQGMIPK